MIFNVNRDDFSAIKCEIPNSGIVVIASRPAWGEDRFIADLLNYYVSMGKTVEVWDLYGNTLNELPDDSFGNSVLVHPVETPPNQRIDSTDFFRHMLCADKDTIVLLIGIQRLQRTPFYPDEMRSIMKTIQEFAQSRMHPVIIYSGLKPSANVHIPSEKDLENIGINKDIGFVVLLDNLYINPCTKPKVGPFFFINNEEFIFNDLDIDKARKQADKLDNPYSHEQLYDDNYTTGDYIEYPRGRVVWDLTNNRAIIYLDPCINNELVIALVRCHFHLNNEKYIVEYDEHYRSTHCISELHGGFL